MKIKITTFNCLAWRWAKKYRNLEAFAPEVANWTEEDWKTKKLDDYQLPNRYQNYIKFFRETGGFFCLQEVDDELYKMILVEEGDNEDIAILKYTGDWYDINTINMIIYVGEGAADLLDHGYEPGFFSIIYHGYFEVENKAPFKAHSLIDTKYCWGKFPIIQINISPGKTFWLLNVHMPGYDRNGPLDAQENAVKRIVQILDDLKFIDLTTQTFSNSIVKDLSDNLIIMGDFNVDVYRNHSGKLLREYLSHYFSSYFSITEPKTQTQIDYIWVPKSKAFSTLCLPPVVVPGSDHLAVSVELNFS